MPGEPDDTSIVHCAPTIQPVATICTTTLWTMNNNSVCLSLSLMVLQDDFIENLLNLLRCFQSMELEQKVVYMHCMAISHHWAQPWLTTVLIRPIIAVMQSCPSESLIPASAPSSISVRAASLRSEKQNKTKHKGKDMLLISMKLISYASHTQPLPAHP